MKLSNRQLSVLAQDIASRVIATRDKERQSFKKTSKIKLTTAEANKITKDALAGALWRKIDKESYKKFPPVPHRYATLIESKIILASVNAADLQQILTSLGAELGFKSSEL